MAANVNLNVVVVSEMQKKWWEKKDKGILQK